MLLAIARCPQVLFFARAQIGRQAVHRPYQIGDRLDRRRMPPSTSGRALQALAHDVGFRTFSPAGVRLDLGDQRLRQSYRESLHLSSVLRRRRLRKTTFEQPGFRFQVQCHRDDQLHLFFRLDCAGVGGETQGQALPD
jgi:hypothetical protein